MIDASQLSLLEVTMAAFVPTAFAAVLIREKGPVGWLSIAGIALVALAVISGLSGGKLAAGFVGLITGLVAGGKFSDWRDLKRSERDNEVDRRRRDARFK